MTYIAISQLYNRLLSNRLTNIIIGCIIMFLFSQITIPLQPVPITLQTVGVICVSLLFKPRDAIAIIMSYLAAGTIGLPMFSNFSSGIAVITGPTGGYLVGFVPAVTFVSLVHEMNKANNVFATIIHALMGTCIIVFFGITWLSTYVGWNAAIELGLLPFIIPGIIKTIITSTIIRYIKN